MVGRGEPPHTRLPDHPPEEPPAARGEEVVGGGEAARRLPGQGHQVGVPAERGDVVLDPAEGELLVPEPSIAGGCLRAQGEEPQGTQPGGDMRMIIINRSLPDY